MEEILKMTGFFNKRYGIIKLSENFMPSQGVINKGGNF